MKVFIILSLVAAALAVPVDQSAYEKPEYKEVDYKEHPTPVKAEAVPAEPKLAAKKYEEPADKTVYPYYVSRGFPYDYRGFPYLNNEFPHGYPTPKHGYYAPLYPAPYQYNAVPAAYHNAPAYQPQYAPAGPVANHIPSQVHQAAPNNHVAVEPLPVHPSKEAVVKPEYDSMKYYGKFSSKFISDL